MPSEILINITPACDLVPRTGSEIDQVRMTLLRGCLLPDGDSSTKKKREKLRKGEPPTSDVTWVLREDAHPYRIEIQRLG